MDGWNWSGDGWLSTIAASGRGCRCSRGTSQASDYRPDFKNLSTRKKASGFSCGKAFPWRGGFRREYQYFAAGNVSRFVHVHPEVINYYIN